SEIAPEQLEATWPAREPIRTLRAIHLTGSSEIRPAIATLCTEHCIRPAECTLVCLGGTPIPVAAETAGRLEMPNMIQPAIRCALTSDGVLPTQGIREYELAI